MAPFNPDDYDHQNVYDGSMDNIHIHEKHLDKFIRPNEKRKTIKIDIETVKEILVLIDDINEEENDIFLRIYTKANKIGEKITGKKIKISEALTFEDLPKLETRSK